MVFDKHFWFYAGLIAFNGFFAFWPHLEWISTIQLAAILLIGKVEVDRQLRLRKIARIRRQIALYQVEILLLEDMINNMHMLPIDIFAYVIERAGMGRLNYENNVNWKRDGF